MQPPLPQQQPQQPRQPPTRRASEQLDDNATLMSLDIEVNTIGDKGARALAAVLGNNSALMALIGDHNNIGAQGARELVAALDTNRTLQLYDLWHDGVTADIKNVSADRVDRLRAGGARRAL